MKLSNLLFVVFLLISSFAYSDIISDLQEKKNNTQQLGITYNVILGEVKDKKAIKYTITEKEDNKLFESSQFKGQMYLLSDGKIFQIPSSAELNPMAPATVTLLGEDFKINDQINYFYFFLNLFLLILFDICGLIFNEFLILLCCGLEFYTYRSISFRAETTFEMGDIFEPETDEQETDE